MSVIDAAYLIHRIADTGKKLELKHISMEEIFGKYKDIMRRVPDLTKAKTLLGYEPEISMEEAIKRMVSFRKKEFENKRP